MSTILDALKKSEQERKLNNIPTLADMPAPEEATRWPMIIGAVVALLLMLLIIVLIITRTSSNNASVRAVSSTVSSQQSVAQSIDENSEIEVNVVSYSDEPEARFVMVNGKMFRQGEFVRAGLKVVEITPESVIFNERGERVERKP